MVKEFTVVEDALSYVKEGLNKFCQGDVSKYNAYELGENILDTLMEIEGVTFTDPYYEFTRSKGIYTSCDPKFGGNTFLQGPDFAFAYINVHAPEFEYSERVILLLTEGTLDEFFGKYLKGHVPKTNLKVPHGVYDIEHTNFGSKLSSINTDDIDEPILSDDLNTKIKKEVTMFRGSRDMYRKHNLEYKRGILMYGPPGNGKTSSLISFFKDYDAITVFAKVISDADLGFVSKFLNTEDLSDTLKVIVFEDLDGMANGLRSEVLNLLDGVTKVDNTIFIATTNYPQNLDSAITKRPSRFDSLYFIDLPSREARSQIIKRLSPNVSDKELEEVTNATSKMSGAFIKEVFVYSKLNKISLEESARTIKKRLEILNEFSGGYVS